jgi:hypothetical protein
MPLGAAASMGWRRLENARSTSRGIAATRKLPLDLSTAFARILLG